ncbi:peptidoglycan-recognition protein LC isoform X2 [Eurosta solidaginis]|uniref:peptidoglycan-recognition protein LC isoform X2 n=1 Tax=Eurosta solidaginis TaxID=178769 RepID=UPI003530F92B
MHLLNDNEINSSEKGSLNLNKNQIIENLSVYGVSSKSVRGAQIIGKTSTLSPDSCASSTDSGIIITDNTRTYNNNESNNYTNLHSNDKNANNHNTNNNCNSKSSNTSYDKSNNNNMESDNHNDKRRHSEDNLKANKNFSINNKIDKDNINIENVINIAAGINNMRRPRHSTTSRTSSKHNSPALSIRSNTISVISIDENAIDSSVVDSDSDYEGQHSDYIVKKLGQQTTYKPDHPNLLHINEGMQVLGQTISPGSLPPTAVPLTQCLINGGTLPTLSPPMSPNTAQIGSIALSNSTDVTFGDKHFYEGPVTIQQIVIDSRNKRKNGEYDGKDKPAHSSDGSDPENTLKTKYATNQPQGPLKYIFNRRAIIIAGLIIILMILAGIIFVTSSHTKQPFRKKPLQDSAHQFNGSLLIISRDEWLAMAEGEGVEILKLPVPRVIVAHTASGKCDTKKECDQRVRDVQAFHLLSNEWGDIGYNFLVGGNGLVYEGRGWNKVGAHTLGYNRDSICIAFIGTFIEELPTENDLKAAQLLIEEGVKLGILAKDYRLYGMRQLSATESPGKALYSIIMKWPHWSRNA